MSTSSSPVRKVDQAVYTSLRPPVANHVPQVPETREELKADGQAVAAKSMSGLRSLVAGGFGGSCSVIVGHPFDIVKVRLQTTEKGVYKNAIDVVRKSIAKDGLARGLYAGVSAPLVGVTPMFAVSFWGYDVGKHVVHRYSVVENSQLSIAQVSFAGFFSAVPQIVLTTPFERVKVLLQVQGQNALGAAGTSKKYSSGLDVVRQLYKGGGIRSVYRGSAATLARDGPGCAAYFSTYEYVKRRLTPVNAATGKASGTLSLTAVTCAGGAAGIVMWILIYPVDTVKSRLQAMEGNPTVGGIIRGLYVGGVRAFFPGFGAAIARAVPANAATFLGVELAYQAMNKVFDEE